MAYFLLYQALPLVLLWVALERICRSPARARWTPALIALAGAAAQFVLWWRSAPDLGNPDSLGFWRIGRGLETDLRALLYRPKLYPLFLAPFPALRAATFAQCLLKLGMAGWLWRAARVLHWRPAALAFALALFLCDNLWLRAPLAILDTTLFAFLFLGAMVLALEAMLRPGPARFAAFCALAGLASLCRQVADPIFLAAGAACLVRYLRARPREGMREWLREWTRPAAAALAGIGLAASGALANGLAHGLYARSVALGVNLYTHYAYYELSDPAAPEWAFVEARLPGAREALPPWRTEWRSDMPWDVNALPHRLERKLGSADAGAIRASDSALVSRALRGMAGKPRRYLSAFANEGARLLFKCEGDYPSAFIARGPMASRLERGLTHLPLWLMALAACAGLAAARGRRWALALPLASAIGYLALIAAVQIGLGRYGMPAWVLLLLPAGQGFAIAADLQRARNRNRGDASKAHPADTAR